MAALNLPYVHAELQNARSRSGEGWQTMRRKDRALGNERVTVTAETPLAISPDCEKPSDHIPIVMSMRRETTPHPAIR